MVVLQSIEWCTFTICDLNCVALFLHFKGQVDKSDGTGLSTVGRLGYQLHVAPHTRPGYLTGSAGWGRHIQLPFRAFVRNQPSRRSCAKDWLEGKVCYADCFSAWRSRRRGCCTENQLNIKKFLPCLNKAQDRLQEDLCGEKAIAQQGGDGGEGQGRTCDCLIYLLSWWSCNPGKIYGDDLFRGEYMVIMYFRENIWWWCIAGKM